MKLFLILIACFLGIYSIFRPRLNETVERKKKIEVAFAHRPQRSPAEFYDSYFKAMGVPEGIVLGVREVLEEHLEADLSRMIDTDDFSKNLNFFWDFDSMADVEIVCALEDMFKIKISDTETATSHTVRDIVELVWRKVDEKA